MSILKASIIKQLSMINYHHSSFTCQRKLKVDLNIAVDVVHGLFYIVC